MTSRTLSRTLFTFSVQPPQEVNVPNDVVNTIFYKVRSLKPVTLTVTVGDNNAGGGSVDFEGKDLKERDEEKDKKGITDLRIPNINDGDVTLEGKFASCTTVVQRTNESSEQISVSYHIRGGVKDETYTFKTTLKKGELADFNTTIVFEPE